MKAMMGGETESESAGGTDSLDCAPRLLVLALFQSLSDTIVTLVPMEA